MKTSCTLTLAVLILASGPAPANIVTEQFTGEVTGGDFLGTVGTGSFSYDSAVVSNSGLHYVTPIEGLTLNFTIFGQTFRETDDFHYDAWPVLAFSDGVPSFLDFVVREGGAGNRTDILTPGVFRINVGGFLIPEADYPWSGGFPVPSSPHGPYVLEDVSVNIQPFPEVSVPASGLLAGLALVALRSRRRRY